MKILLINWAAADPAFAQRYRSHHMAEEWAKAGHDVTIVAGTFSHLHSQEVTGEGKMIETRSAGVRYLHLRAPVYHGSGVHRARNILAYILQSLRREEAIAAFGPFDLVISATVYQVDNFSAYRIAKRHHCPWFRETRDLWPMTLYDLGGVSRSHPFARWVQRGEDLACRKASLVISTLPGAFEHFKTRGLSESRFRWSPQGCAVPSNSPETLPEEHAQLFASLRAKGRTIGVMTGGLVPAINLPLLLEAAPIAASRGVSVVIVGSGELEGLVRNAIGEDLHLLPRIPQGAMPSLLAAADFGISGSNNLNLYRYGVSPNKVSEYMANGLPVVLHVPYGKNLVEEAGAGVVVGADSAANLAGAMVSMANLSHEERAEMGRRGQNFMRTRASIPVLAQQYLSWCAESNAPD